MASCPNCKRNSLEYSDKRKTAWCLYVEDCGFQESVENYERFIEVYATSVVTTCHHDSLHEDEVVS